MDDNPDHYVKSLGLSDETWNFEFNQSEYEKLGQNNHPEEMYPDYSDKHDELPLESPYLKDMAEVPMGPDMHHDDFFTPLLSPMVQHTQPPTNPKLNVNDNFSPLTSPALASQNSRRKLSTESSSSVKVRIRRQSNSSYSGKSKTPGSTPKLSSTSAVSNSSNKVIKQSPAIKARRNPGLSNNLHRTLSSNNTFALPESAQTTSTTATAELSNTLNIEANNSDEFTNTNSVTPSTLMSFGHIPHHSTSNVIFDGLKHSSVVLPSSKNANGRNTTKSPNSIAKDGTDKGRKADSASPPTIPTGTLTKRPSKSDDPKKVNHKLAEQGRRNRMNFAIQRLEDLIPGDYKEDTTVPSKATTVEMAVKYIKELQNQLEKLEEQRSK
ncbi:hypothetical protein LJB42_000190 [Komagataella kurtzmanii]|nr:hypothetical protein LJB42_000190 [Komagataella kurtzmanii]